MALSPMIRTFSYLGSLKQKFLIFLYFFQSDVMVGRWLDNTAVIAGDVRILKYLLCLT